METETERRGSTLRIVARDVGALQVLLSGTMLASLAVSLLFGELHSALAFLISALVSAGCGAAAFHSCRDAADPQRRHAMIIAGAGWLTAAAFGALPFLFAAYLTPEEAARALIPAGTDYPSSLPHFRNPLHAFFESMSAYTTTGLTMAVHEPTLGRGLLFYRSITQWIGGAGMVVLSLAIIPRPHLVGELALYQSETTGMKLRPSILGTAREIWKIYFALTGLAVLSLFLGTVILMPGYGTGAALFNAVNHGMTGVATGGFSVLSGSIGAYGSYAMELLHIPPMLLGAVSIPLYYSFLRERDARVFWRDPQFRLMLLIFAAVIPLLAFLLRGQVADPLRASVFQVVSGLTSTGWQTSRVADWGVPGLLLLAWGTMIFDAAAGSTTGGVKLIRGYIIAQAIVWRVRKVFLPAEAVLPVRLGDKTLSSESLQREAADAAVFTCFYFFLLFASILLAAYWAEPHFTTAQVIFETISAQSCIGLSTGLTHPGMPPAIELLFIFQMWIGRLEIFPVIILLRALILWSLRR